MSRSNEQRVDISAEELIYMLTEAKEYIEEMEIRIENERGELRPLEKLIQNGEMPHIYNKVNEFIDFINK